MKPARPLLATLSIVFQLIALPVGRLAIFVCAPTEDYLENGALDLALSGFIPTLVFKNCPDQYKRHSLTWVLSELRRKRLSGVVIRESQVIITAIF